MKTLTADNFREALRKKFAFAERMGKTSIDVNSGTLHREIGIYPQPGHSMPTCCNVMREVMNQRDVVLSSPPKGRGATLTIHYVLPRQ